MSKIRKDEKTGWTTVDLSEDVQLSYDPGKAEFILEDFRASDAVLTTRIKDEILDQLYNAAWYEKRNLNVP